jgi:hypothetical protein
VRGSPWAVIPEPGILLLSCVNDVVTLVRIRYGTQRLDTRCLCDT